MEIFDFNRVRQLLLDPSPDAKQDRAKLLQSAELTKTTSLLGIGVSGIFALISLVIAVSFPFFGILGVIFWSLTALASREVYVLSDNIIKMFDDSGLFGNILSRTVSAISPSVFTQSLLANTWVIDPLFGASIRRGLEGSY